MDSFIVDIWARLFGALRWLSPFHLLRALVPAFAGNKAFVDLWVSFHLVLSVTLVGVSCPGTIVWWEWIALLYAAVRVFELVVYQVNVLLFDEYRAHKAGRPYAVGSYRRLVILAGQNYIEVLAWFALWYRNFSDVFRSDALKLDSVAGSVYFSVITMMTVGYGDIRPVSRAGAALTVLQVGLGLFLAVVVISRFISLLRSPATSDEIEDDKRL